LAKTIDKAKLDKNRQETAYSRPTVEIGDRLLSKDFVRHNGKKVAALLYEVRNPQTPESVKMGCSDSTGVYTSATIVVTQDSRSVVHPQSAGLYNMGAPSASETTEKGMRRIYERISILWSKIGPLTRRRLQWLSRDISQLQKTVCTSKRFARLIAGFQVIKRKRP